MNTSFPLTDFVMRISLDGRQQISGDSSSDTLNELPLRQPIASIGSSDTLAITLKHSPTSTFSVQASSPRLSGFKFAMAVASLGILPFMSAVYATIATTYAPIGSKLGSQDFAEWIVGSYLVALAPSQPLFAAITKLLGRLESLYSAVLVFLVGSILCGLSTTVPMLIASRAIQGIGGAGLASMPVAIIAEIAAEHMAGTYVGGFGAVYMAGLAIGPLIGSAAVHAKWELMFWASVPFTLAALLTVAILLRIPRAQGTFASRIARIDIIGSLLFISGAVLLALALLWGGRAFAWSSAQVVCPLAIGAAVLVLFILYEWKAAQTPLLPVRLVKSRNVAAASASGLLLGFVVYHVVTATSKYAQVVGQASAVVSGAYLAALCAGVVLSAVASGLLVVWTGRCREIIVAEAACVVLGSGLLIALDAGSGPGKLVGFLFLCGLGLGGWIYTTNLLVHASVGSQHMAAVFSTCVSLGMMASAAVSSNVIQAVVRSLVTSRLGASPAVSDAISSVFSDLSLLSADGAPQPFADAFITAYASAQRMGFIVLAAVAGLLFAVSFWFKRAE
ncbi:hypothetical protein H4S01_005175 [Coemansia sp. RSA 2610]|nr:hypothetical protein H4S01_005175 [Coemansia sp. RSA 2610]